MTKTISFAPPRGAATVSRASSGRSQNSIPAAKRPAAAEPAQPRNAAKGAAPVSETRGGPRIATVSAREVLEKAAKPRRKAAGRPEAAPVPPSSSSKRSAAKAEVPQTAVLPLEAPAAPKMPAPAKAKTKAKTEVRPQIIVTLTLPLTVEPEPAPAAPKPARQKRSVPAVEPAAPAPAPAPAPAAKTKAPAKPAPAKAKASTPKAKGKAKAAAEEMPKPVKRRGLSKVPDNLAEQYGQNLSRRAVAPAPEVEQETARKRMTREEREKRRQLMAPDPGLLQRLARAHAAASTAPKRVSKPRGWELCCGRCGTVTRFTTPGGICPKCGAIGVKE